jgi:uncharacterized membrane protein
MVAIPIQRPLWFDELYTYYIAAAPDLRTLFAEITQIDLNPPMIYLVTRGWQQIFGVGETVTRIPSVVAFFLAALGFYRFLRPRMGATWAAASMLLFWCTPYFRYATELRPYALLLFFFSIALVSWDHARQGSGRTVALAGILFGGIGMMLCHVVAIFSLGAICLAELVRQWRVRRVDWAIWSCLLLPGCLLAVYVPILHAVATVLYPPTFQAGPRKIAVFFARAALGIILPFGLATAAAVIVSKFRWSRLRDLRRIQAPDFALAAGLLSTPFILNLLMARDHGAFFERYAITCAVLISVLAVLLLGQLSAFSPSAGVALSVVFLSTGLWINLYEPLVIARQVFPRMDTIRPDLDFVVSGGTGFLEIDHYEDSNFLRRVYYLTDRDAAATFAHATNFEVIAVLKQYFPIRANVSTYRDFVRQHSHFLVLADIGFPEEWLCRKLQHDGALLTPISGPVRKSDGAIIYDVQLR